MRSTAHHPEDAAEPRTLTTLEGDHSDSDRQIPVAGGSRPGAAAMMASGPVTANPEPADGDPAPDLSSERGWRQLDEILAILSHDLRSPLSAISIGIDALADPDLDGSTRDRYLAAMRRAITRSERFLDDLVDFSRIAAGTLAVDVTPARLLPLLERVAQDHEAVAQGAGNYLVLECGEGVDKVLADPGRLEQVLDKILINALRYARGTGAVSLKAERVSDPEGDTVRLWVIDHGPGIPERELDQLFDRCWRGSGVRRSGAGIGLAIARGVLEAMGGTLHVESRPGDGTRVCVELRAG